MNARLQRISKICSVCNTSYEVKITFQDRITFCTAKCQHESMRGIPLSEEHRKKVSDGLKKHLPSTAFKKGKVPINKGKYKKVVGYSAIHKWLYTQVGKAKKCSKCGSEKTVNWANVSGLYHRDVDDFVELCRSCHNSFDHGWTKNIIYRAGKNWRPELKSYLEHADRSGTK